MASKIRTFISIPVPLSVQEAVGVFIKDLKACGSDVKWVSPVNLHLTLKFLGDVEEHVISDIASCCAEAAASFSPFSVEIGGTGAFPNLHRPKVLWLGITKGFDELKNFASIIDQSLAEIGFKKDERPFSGHVTIGRVRSLMRIKQVAETMDRHGFEPHIFNADAVHVMKSKLTQSGPVYSILNTINL